MSRNGLLAGAVAAVGNGLVWVSQTEQIWFPMAGAFWRYIEPMYDLPDLRGPFAFLTLCYIGLRLGDMWDKREEIEEL